jgi:hypothetical protein
MHAQERIWSPQQMALGNILIGSLRILDHRFRKAASI